MKKKVSFVRQKNQACVKALPFIIQPGETKLARLADLSIWIKNNRRYILTTLHVHGAILFRGYSSESIDDFAYAAKAFGRPLLSYRGGDFAREIVSDRVYTSTSYGPTLDIPLHNEKSFSNNFPKLLFFCCLLKPDKDGETTLSDGRLLYEQIGKDFLHEISQKKLKYKMILKNAPSAGETWQRCFETNNKLDVENYLIDLKAKFQWNADGSITVEEIVKPAITHPHTNEFVFFSQADQWYSSDPSSYQNCCYGDGTPLDIKKLILISNIAKKQQQAVQWEQGDFLIVDNILTLHGRNSYLGNRKILVIMS